MSGPGRDGAEVFAFTRVGPITVAVEGRRVAGFLEAGEREVDCDLAGLLGIPIQSDAGELRLVELRHAQGSLVLAVHDRVRMSGEHLARHERPAMVAGALRRACFLAVLRLDDELAYILDVEELAARIGRRREERMP